MFQVIAPLPERNVNGSKIDTHITNSVDAKLLEAAGKFSVMHGTIQTNDGTKVATKFYVFEIEKYQLTELKASLFKVKRMLRLNSIAVNITELKTMAID